jgi:hypothetical protein
VIGSNFLGSQFKFIIIKRKFMYLPAEPPNPPPPKWPGKPPWLKVCEDAAALAEEIFF